MYKRQEFVVHGLAAHLQPTLVRLANNMKIENPLLDQIKRDYAAIFERCRSVAEVIEEHYGYPVPEPELSLIHISSRLPLWTVPALICISTT